MNQQYLSILTSPSPSGSGTAANPIVLEEPEAPSIRVSLKDYPTTSGKSTDYPRFKRLFKSVATAGGHAEILAKGYKVPDAVNDQKAYERYLKLNKKTFSALDHALAGSTLWTITERFRDTEDGLGAWLALENCQKGEGCEETCATNALDDLRDLKLTPNYPGGAEAFISKWDEIIQTLEELNRGTKNPSEWKKPSKFLERSLFKEAIVDPDFEIIITNLDMLTVPPTLKKCKSEVRQRGKKLEKKQKAQASRRAALTRAWEDYWEGNGAPDDFSDEDFWTITAVMNRQGGGRPRQGQRQSRYRQQSQRLSLFHRDEW